MPVIIIGGIMSGIFYGDGVRSDCLCLLLIIGIFVYRELKIKKPMGRIYRLCKIDRSGADRGCLRLPVYLVITVNQGTAAGQPALLTENIGK